MSCSLLYLFVCTVLLPLPSPVFGQANCTVDPCQNGGLCIQETDSCECPFGFFGDQCAEDPCAPNPCTNGACNRTATSFQCVCADGFIGFMCEIPNPCTDNPCLNNGTCMIAAGGTNASCTCVDGYAGAFCSERIDPGIQPTSTAADVMPSTTPPVGTPSPVSPCQPLCQNGGTCTVHIDYGPTCDCPFGWGGVSCEIELDIVIPRFQGRGYLTYQSLAVGDTVFRLSFRTTQSSGLLLFNGQSALGYGDYVQLSLSEGCLDYRVDLGKGVQPLVLGHRVNDGQWHEVSITRIGRMSIMVLDSNDTLTVSSTAPGDFVSLNVDGSLYIGGIPTGVVLPSSANMVPGFVGCVYGFEEEQRSASANQPTGGINVAECESSICQFALCVNGGACTEDRSDPKGYNCTCRPGFTGDFCSEATCVSDPCLFGGTCVPSGDGSYYCVCAYGYAGPNCATIMNITTPVFYGSSHLSYRMDPSAITDETEVSVRVRTASVNSTGIVMFAAQRLDGRGDFLLVGVDNDIVYCQFDLGSGSVVIRSPGSLLLGVWSSIAITRTANLMTVTLDNNPLASGTSPGSFVGLQVSNTLFVGGVSDVQMKPSAVPMTAWRGFDGCVTDIAVSDVSQSSALVGIDSGRNVGECEVDACFYFTCYNGGSCEVAANRTAVCVCPTGYLPPTCVNMEDRCLTANPCSSGSTCMTDENGQLQCLCPYGRDGQTCSEGINIATPSFNKSEYAHMQLPMLPSSVGPSTTIAFSVLPVTPNGLILYSSLYYMPTTLDFVAVLMKDGYLEFRYNLGSGTAVIRSAQPLPLEEWHEIRAYRTGTIGYVSVNGANQVTGVSSGSTQSLNLNTPLYVGGAPDYRTLAPSAGVTQGFGGCLDNIVINNVRQSVSVATATRDLQNCGEDPCSTLQCLNGGVCTDGSVRGEFVCMCPANYSGDRCELGTPNPCLNVECGNGGQCLVDLGLGRCGCPVPYGGTTCQDTLTFADARFSGLSYIELYRYAFSSLQLNRDEFSLNFRTGNSSGLLLWVGGQTVGGSDYMALGINRGRLELRFDLGNGAVLLRPSQIVSDGNWHSVTVVRDAGTATLSLNGRESNVTSTFVNLDTSSNIWIGGHADISSTVFDSSLVGCVRNVRINMATVDLDSNFNTASSLDITPCT